MAHVGCMPCPVGCGSKEAAVSHAATGTRNIKCGRCGFSGYGGVGSKAARLIDEKTIKDDEPGAPPAPAAKQKSTLLG